MAPDTDVPGDRGVLPALLEAIARGEMPPADGTIRVVAQPSHRDAGVFAFTAHIVVAADVDPAWALGLLPPGDLSEPLNPPFLTALCEKIGRRVPALDLVTLGPRSEGLPPLRLREVPAAGLADHRHPRVRRALRYREDLRVFETEGGVLLLGRGVAGRWEAAFEVEEAFRGRGLGRRLAESARHLVPSGAAVWAQVSPGNAASVRALFAAGFQPVGSEALLVAH